ncbi:MAG: hypothetical protein JSW17_03215 [Candidatus Omnitrophota bacterium]|nr:MAG: hypothetical protein JSW17_03215 [Candidatus Omnitrophota bacterium]
MTEKDKKNLIIVGVLIAVLIFMIANATKRVKRAKGRIARSKSVASARESKKGKRAELPEGAIVEVSKARPSAANIFSRLDMEAESISLKRDPFSMRTISVEEEIASHGVRLSGILWDKRSPRAVINDEIVSVGDKFNDYTVSAIEKDKVILSEEEGSITLRLVE